MNQRKPHDQIVTVPPHPRAETLERIMKRLLVISAGLPRVAGALLPRRTPAPEQQAGGDTRAPVSWFREGLLTASCYES